MKDVLDRTWDIDKLGDIVLDNLESRVSIKMAQVGGCASDQVVNRQNIPAMADEAVAKVRPEKSSAARDYRAQMAIPSLLSLFR